MWKGGAPDWLNEAAASYGVAGQPYFIDGDVGGFVYDYPLHAAAAGSQTNKILWVFLTHSRGEMQLSGHPFYASTPTVNETLAPAAGSDRAFPSVVDVPDVGCWEFTLSNGVQTATVDLIYY